MTTHGERTSPIGKLSKELRDLICEHVASPLHSALHHSSLPEDDPWIFLWSEPSYGPVIVPWSPPQRPPDCQIIQKRLRALSLVSQDWSHSAQRALFAVIPIDSARCLMKLLRSLLLYPKNRRYIRCLIPIFMEPCVEFYMQSPIGDDTAGMITMSLFVDNLGDILFTPIVEELPNAALLCTTLIKHVLHPHLLAGGNHEDTGESEDFDDHVYRFREVLNSALCCVIHISPSLSALHLRTEWHHCAQPFVYGEAMNYSKRFLEGSRPLFKTLSLYAEGFPGGGRRRDHEDLEYECWMACIPTIQYLTLLGYRYQIYSTYRASLQVCLNTLYEWLNSVVQLTSLRLLNGFDESFDATSARVYTNWVPAQHNWNSILLRHKDTLKELVLDGYRGAWLHDVNKWDHESSHTTRFGPTRMLSCLPELRNLAYLRVPLHFLMSSLDPHSIDEDAQAKPENLPSPSTAQEALALIESSFPPSLKKLEIVVYGFYLNENGFGMLDELRTITVRF